jgi:type IV fimbrial biogenesis protein FimT
MTSVNHLARLAKRQRGFSLIELMLTLVIAATLMGVAVPAFRGVVNSNRVIAQSNDIVAALNLARSEAITRNTNIKLCGAATATSTTCSTTSPWVAWVVLNGSTLVRGGDINSYSSTLKVTSSGLTNASVTYSSDGLARTNGVLLGTSQYIQVCTTFTKLDKNVYRVAPGVGSRIVTTTSKGSCP